MLQYLLNATAIWALSLLLFDAFLRKESYHGYNRLYLLFTMLVGALLPLVQLESTAAIYPDTIQRPVAQVIAAKQNIIAATTPTNSIAVGQWLLAAYLIGAGIALGLLIKDIAKLIAMSHSGVRSKQGVWVIIETGKEHTPFSFRKILFVNSIGQYSPDEWAIILEHEAQHDRLLHLADVLLLQISKIIFWFHPLSYIYAKRLLLVHEYQADHFARQQPQAYGQFLIEQALLGAAPTISHSFNRSPIKKRILMLTRTSSSISKGKMLVLLPLAFACMLCFTKASFSQNAKAKYIIVTGLGANNADIKQTNYTTYEKVMAEPRLICNVPGAKVTEFTISYLPKGKDYQGPYKITGSELSGIAKKLLMEEKESKSPNPDTRIFIEEIHVLINGKDSLTAPIIMRCKPS
jgi:hypothetical protein